MIVDFFFYLAVADVFVFINEYRDWGWMGESDNKSH